MGITTFHRNPRGDVIGIDNDHLGVAQRVQEGDPTAGWSGDRRMYVMFNNSERAFEIWRRTDDGKEHFVKGFPVHEWDSRVLVWLAEHDSWSRDILGEIETEEAARDRKSAEELHELEGELRKDLEWINEKLYMPGFDAPRPG